MWTSLVLYIRGSSKNLIFFLHFSRSKSTYGHFLIFRAKFKHTFNSENDSKDLDTWNDLRFTLCLPVIVSRFMKCQNSLIRVIIQPVAYNLAFKTSGLNIFSVFRLWFKYSVFTQNEIRNMKKKKNLDPLSQFN